MPREARRQYGEETKKKQSVAGQEAVRRAKTVPAEPPPRHKKLESSHIQLVEGKQKPNGFTGAASLSDLRGVGIPEVTAGGLESGEGSPTSSVEQQRAAPLRGYRHGGRTMADRQHELARRKRKRRKRRCITFLLVIAVLALCGLTVGAYLAVQHRRQQTTRAATSLRAAAKGRARAVGSGERHRYGAWIVVQLPPLTSHSHRRGEAG
tara:strand:- start:623 stop:1246 length:624 start_codon:yes stop_codon:yes gene_type:complete